MPASLPSLPITADFSLREFNTFGLAARADAYLPVYGAEDLARLLDDAVWSKVPRLMLGGGSNIVLRTDFHGVVLHSCSRGIDIIAQDAQYTVVRCAAGESWQALVDWTLARQLGGLENLSLIPGSVGAAPIQNIGAYGVEMASRFHSLRAFDFRTASVRTFDASACQFGYRDSIFKRALAGAAMILDVSFALPRHWKPDVRYAELAQALSAIAAPGMQQVAAAVNAIRRRKLPDPAQLGNAGSFFKNPLVSRVQRDALLAQFPGLVSHDQPDDMAKLAAGWLIDQCGWKGRAIGAAAVHDRQALVLVNRGGARAVDVIALAQAIQADVLQRFGVQLEVEPVLV